MSKNSFDFSRLALEVKETPPNFLAEHSVAVAPSLADRRRVSLPPQHSLKSKMTAVRNQGGIATCASFAVVACLEYLHKNQDLPERDLDLSEAHITHAAEKKYGDCKETIAIVHALQIALDEGIVSETVWKYDGRQICWSRPPSTAGAKKYRFESFWRVFECPRHDVIARMQQNRLQEPSGRTTPGESSDKVKTVLYRARSPVVLDVPVYPSANWENGPHIQMPRPSGVREWLRLHVAPGGMVHTPLKPTGWHALSICGYDDATARFDFKNSWGKEEWGEEGYGTIPYRYIDRYSSFAAYGSLKKAG